MALGTCKTRFVCISDTHNASPENGSFKLPNGDVLVHAGDLTKQGTAGELRKTLDWLDKADFEVKLVVAGNHDITLDHDFYAEHGLYFHNQHPEDSEACRELIKEYKSLTFLNHEAACIRLQEEGGPRTTFNVFGSPYSPRHGLWAFGYPPEAASTLWDKIPLQTDIVITHTPPKYHCDESGSRAAIGCEGLRQALWRVRPSLSICGHVHEGRGAQRVIWDLDSPNVKYKERVTGYWEDPGQNNKKQSFLDLTTKCGSPLQNSGPWDNSPNKLHPSTPASMPGTLLSPDTSDEPDAPAVRGQGGSPFSGRCDQEALAGRMGRQETCIINCAIMASSWPYKSSVGRKYNKPIVVDLELPVWDGDDEPTQGRPS